MDIVKIVSDDATGDEETVEELPEVRINCQIRTKIYKVEKSICLFSILFLYNWPFSDRVADDAMIINLASFIGLRWMFYLFTYEVSTPCKGKWLVSCKP